MFTNETILVDIQLTEEIKALLHDQNSIQSEMSLNVTEMSYPDYAAFLDDNRERDFPFITEKILEQLFSTYTELDKIKNQLFISTFRTVLLSQHGLNGETSLHKDNIYFPFSTDRNLLISWGLGTEAATLTTSKFLDKIRYTVYEKAAKANDYTIADRDYKLFQQAFFENPDEEIAKIMNNYPRYKPEFVSIVEEALEVFPDMKYNGEKVIRSLGPNESGNISAICLSGRDVYHKRTAASENTEPFFRYVLNIYFSSNQQHTGTDSGNSKANKKTRTRTHRTVLLRKLPRKLSIRRSSGKLSVRKSPRKPSIRISKKK
jgi:hypothetical protein